MRDCEHIIGISANESQQGLKTSDNKNNAYADCTCAVFTIS